MDNLENYPSEAEEKAMQRLWSKFLSSVRRAPEHSLDQTEEAIRIALLNPELDLPDRLAIIITTAVVDDEDLVDVTVAGSFFVVQSAIIVGVVTNVLCASGYDVFLASPGSPVCKILAIPRKNS